MTKTELIRVIKESDNLDVFLYNEILDYVKVDKKHIITQLRKVSGGTCFYTEVYFGVRNQLFIK